MVGAVVPRFRKGMIVALQGLRVDGHGGWRRRIAAIRMRPA